MTRTDYNASAPSQPLLDIKQTLITQVEQTLHVLLTDNTIIGFQGDHNLHITPTTHANLIVVANH